MLRVDPINRDGLIERLDLNATARPVVALLPGAAYGPAKQWPIGHYTALARTLTDQDLAVWVMGSASEKSIGEEIRAGSGAVNLCGQTNLEDTVDLLSVTRAAVTNDSGLMHVAAAAGTEVLAIYGSTSPDFTPPLTPDRGFLSATPLQSLLRAHLSAQAPELPAADQSGQRGGSPPPVHGGPVTPPQGPQIFPLNLRHNLPTDGLGSSFLTQALPSE